MFEDSNNFSIKGNSKLNVQIVREVENINTNQKTHKHAILESSA